MAQCNSVIDHAVVPKRDILQVLLSAQSLNVPILQFFLHQIIDVPVFFFSEIKFISYAIIPLPFTQYH